MFLLPLVFSQVFPVRCASSQADIRQSAMFVSSCLAIVTTRMCRVFHSIQCMVPTWMIDSSMVLMVMGGDPTSNRESSYWVYNAYY